MLYVDDIIIEPNPVEAGKPVNITIIANETNEGAKRYAYRYPYRYAAKEEKTE